MERRNCIGEMKQDDTHKIAIQWKERGNVHYGKKEYGEAAMAYKTGLQLLEGSDLTLELALRANLAMVLLKLEKFDKAEEECDKILEQDSANTKGESCLFI